MTIHRMFNYIVAKPPKNHDNVAVGYFRGRCALPFYLSRKHHQHTQDQCSETAPIACDARNNATSSAWEATDNYDANGQGPKVMAR